MGKQSLRLKQTFLFWIILEGLLHIKKHAHQNRNYVASSPFADYTVNEFEQVRGGGGGGGVGE